MERVAREIDTRKEYENALTEYTSVLRGRSNMEKIAELSELRSMPIKAIEDAGIFYIRDMAEMMVPKYLNTMDEFGLISVTNKKPIFSNRWVIPIKTVGGRVQNLVGYSNTADERYIYGKAKYYLRRDTLFGLENLNVAYKLGYAVLTEGITDTIRLRSLGILNSFAMCGTHQSSKIMAQLNRCRHGIIIIPDRDAAGESARKNWVTNRFAVLNIYLGYKDVDEMLREKENEEPFKIYMEECVKWLKAEEHLGYKHGYRVLTMI